MKQGWILKVLAGSAMVCALTPQEAEAKIRNPALLIGTIPLLSLTTFTLVYSLFVESPKSETEKQEIRGEAVPLPPPDWVSARLTPNTSPRPLPHDSLSPQQ